MGFAADTAATVDADLYKYTGEQQLANLQRGNTWVELHKGAATELVTWLHGKGFSDAQISGITNTTDFLPALAALVVSKIFCGQGGRDEGARQAALSKGQFYERRWLQLREAVVVMTSDGKKRSSRGLPMVMNTDVGTVYPALGSPERYRGTAIGRDEISGFDRIVVEGT